MYKSNITRTAVLGYIQITAAVYIRCPPYTQMLCNMHIEKIENLIVVQDINTVLGKYIELTNPF